MSLTTQQYWVLSPEKNRGIVLCEILVRVGDYANSKIAYIHADDLIKVPKTVIPPQRNFANI